MKKQMLLAVVTGALLIGSSGLFGLSKAQEEELVELFEDGYSEEKAIIAKIKQWKLKADYKFKHSGPFKNKGYLIHLAALHEQPGVLQYLVDQTPKRDRKKVANLKTTDNGKTPLHYAAFTPFVVLAKILVEAGADKGARDDKFGMSPLHYAAGASKMHDTYQMVKYLTEKSEHFAHNRDKKSKKPREHAGKGSKVYDVIWEMESTNRDALFVPRRRKQKR